MYVQVIAAVYAVKCSPCLNLQCWVNFCFKSIFNTYLFSRAFTLAKFLACFSVWKVSFGYMKGLKSNLSSSLLLLLLQGENTQHSQEKVSALIIKMQFLIALYCNYNCVIALVVSERGYSGFQQSLHRILHGSLCFKIKSCITMENKLTRL